MFTFATAAGKLPPWYKKITTNQRMVTRLRLSAFVFYPFKDIYQSILERENTVNSGPNAVKWLFLHLTGNTAEGAFEVFDRLF